MGNNAKIFLLFVGDAIALYAALFVMLFIRYGNGYLAAFENVHAAPFTLIFIAWLIIFYISGLYDLRRLRNNLEFLKMLSLVLIVNAGVAILFFYAIPFFGIAPKTNLFLFVIIFAIIEIVWRRFFNRTVSFGEAPNRVVVVGNGTIAEAERTITENAQFGYTVVGHLGEAEAEADPRELETLVGLKRANLVIVPNHLKRGGKLPATLYKLFGKGILITDVAAFHELILRKVPLADLEETWFLENIEGAGRFYDPLKRAGEFLAALAIGLVLLPFELAIALLVVLTSFGPAIYSQTRVGKNGQEFTLYKFRTMRRDAEQHGAQWATQGDHRVTLFGKFLRASHLDELPQLANIINGDLSFVGPRPERPEFVAKLKEQIPYYDARLLIKPGVTGWAQINHRADLDLEDVKEKLQYDLYYLKNRSATLDLAIIVKTAKSIFINPD